MQLDQQPVGAEQRDLLAAEVLALPGVREQESLISVPGARAIHLDDTSASPPDAFMIGAEFAHLHPEPDQSLHVMLPPDLVDEAVEAGWAEVHPVARRGLMSRNGVMLFAPRDDSEREVIAWLVRASHAYATGRQQPHA
jgi:hypothetical protein